MADETDTPTSWASLADADDLPPDEAALTAPDPTDRLPDLPLKPDSEANAKRLDFLQRLSADPARNIAAAYRAAFPQPYGYQPLTLGGALRKGRALLDEPAVWDCYVKLFDWQKARTEGKRTALGRHYVIQKLKKGHRMAEAMKNVSEYRQHTALAAEIEGLIGSKKAHTAPAGPAQMLPISVVVIERPGGGSTTVLADTGSGTHRAALHLANERPPPDVIEGGPFTSIENPNAPD